MCASSSSKIGGTESSGVPLFGCLGCVSVIRTPWSERVAAAPRVVRGVERNDVGRRRTSSQLLGHEAHRRVDVVEEVLVAGAEVVEAGLAVGRLNEAVLRAAAVA